MGLFVHHQSIDQQKHYVNIIASCSLAQLKRAVVSGKGKNGKDESNDLREHLKPSNSCFRIQYPNSVGNLQTQVHQQRA